MGRNTSHHGRMLFLMAFLGACAALGGVTPSRAQTAGVPAQLAGTWVYAGSSTHAMSIVTAAFEPSIRSFPELFQGIARDRVRSSMVPPSRVVVGIAGERVRVTLHTDRTMEIDGAIGSTARATGTEGSPRVSTHLRGGWLEVRYEGEGDMQQLFSTEPDGARMHVDFTVVSERLPAPVRYRLDYVHP